jgi:CheY-like chemotaxis protein
VNPSEQSASPSNEECMDVVRGARGNDTEGERVMTTHPILVVEDEFLIALDIVAALEQAGIAVAGPAGTVGEALSAIEREPLRGALLDAHLGGESAGNIADALVARGIPFAFVSGYGPESLPPAHRGSRLVRKPFTDQDLLAAIAGF